jgi:hypothetical protein
MEMPTIYALMTEARDRRPDVIAFGCYLILLCMVLAYRPAIVSGRGRVSSYAS